MERPKPLLQRPFKSFALVFLIGAASLALMSAADETKAAKAPDGRAVLMRMADYLAKSPAWSVTVQTAYDAVQPDGFKVEWNGTRTVTVKRPNMLRVESVRSDGARSLVLFDGKTITSFDETAKVYAQKEHPGTLDTAVVFFVRDLGMRLPLAVMLTDRLPDELQQRVKAVKYVEKTTTMGAPADHIAAKTPTVDFQVWVAQGDRPLPVRVVLTYKNTRGEPQFMAQFSDWNIDIQPSDTLFAFKPPEGARQIPFAAALANVAPAREQGSASGTRGSASRMKGGRQ
jgi:hypothetical protein